MMAIPHVSWEEQKAPGALEGAGHCSCVKDAHGHVAPRAHRHGGGQGQGPAGCRCSCPTEPMRAGHRELLSPLVLWSKSPKTKEQFPLIPCHPLGELSFPKPSHSNSQLQSQLCKASCWDNRVGFFPFLRDINLPLATWCACLWICSFSCSLAQK